MANYALMWVPSTSFPAEQVGCRVGGYACGYFVPQCSREVTSPLQALAWER